MNPLHPLHPTQQMGMALCLTSCPSYSLTERNPAVNAATPSSHPPPSGLANANHAETQEKTMLLPNRPSHLRVKSRIHPSHDVAVALMFPNGEQSTLFLEPDMAAQLGRQILAEVGAEVTP